MENNLMIFHSNEVFLDCICCCCVAGGMHSLKSTSSIHTHTKLEELLKDECLAYNSKAIMLLMEFSFYFFFLQTREIELKSRKVCLVGGGGGKKKLVLLFTMINKHYRKN